MIDFSKINWRATRYEGIHLHFLRRDEATGDATVLIRMEPGCSYPAHRHVGVEEVFVLQGGYADARGLHRAGDYVLNEAGSAHAPTALEETGEDCVMLAVAHGGIEILKRSLES
ncbi:MAG TPA: cupin domain-containing protein [Pyrinomonadaceae bacterium]|jgi:anti-sigma factor ChrR (cupin superfamily)|nr:cupin domain-containing protein [Pyrinomonadaceae bacterium]